MTLDERIKRLQDLARRFNDLMQHPEPGIGMWMLAVGQVLTQIAAFAPSYSPSGGDDRG